MGGLRAVSCYLSHVWVGGWSISGFLLSSMCIVDVCEDMDTLTGTSIGNNPNIQCKKEDTSSLVER